MTVNPETYPLSISSQVISPTSRIWIQVCPQDDLTSDRKDTQIPSPKDLSLYQAFEGYLDICLVSVNINLMIT